MQEADKMIDEMDVKVKRNIKQALNPMNYVRLHDNFKRIENKLKKINQFFDMDNHSENIEQYKMPVKFVGQHTDIANITRYENELMPCSELKSIDSNIKENVYDEFLIAQQNGFIQQVNVDGQDYYKLTAKGKNHIQTDEFLRQYEKHQTQAIVKNSPSMIVKFQGNEDDLNVFRYTNQINISKEEHKVVNYFYKLEQENWVTIGPDGNVKPTEKTTNWLARKNDNLLAKGNMKPVTTNIVEDVVQKAQKMAIGNTVTIPVPKAAEKTVVNEAAKATGKAAATVTKEGVKQTATKAATSVGAASGAATAGVGTVITVSAESMKKLLQAQQALHKQLENTTTHALKK